MMMGPTKKKVITTGIVAFIIPVVLGSIFFINYNKSKNEEIAKLQKQSHVIDRFVFAENMIAGDIITAEDLKGVQVKAESAPIDSFVSGDAALEKIVGRKMRINAEKKTIVAASMFTEEDDTLSKDERLQEFNMIALPSDLEVGDFVDLRITMPTGENYIVVNGKEVKQIGSNADSNAVFLQLNEEEILRTTAAVLESYLDDGYKIYANKYVKPSEQLYDYTRVDYVKKFEDALKALLEERQKFADENLVEYLKKYKAEDFEKVSGDIVNVSGEVSEKYKVSVTEEDITTLEIANKIGLTEKQAQDIRNALNENDETVLVLYNDKLVTTRKEMINTYPVKTNIANLIKSNPDILQTIKNKYNIAELEAQRADLKDYPLYDYNDYGEYEATEALSKLHEKITKEIETQKAERKQYLQALILKENSAK